MKEQPTPGSLATEKTNEGKFGETRGKAIRWCGYALSSAGRPADADIPDEE